MNVLIAGDFCDTNRVSSYILKKDFNHLFSGIKQVVETCDLSIVNFEFPVHTNYDKKIKKYGPALGGGIESIDAIKYAGFNVCTLANNHILDLGERNCLETKKMLEAAGIKTVGVGRNITDASESLFIEKEQKIVCIINCCEHEFSIASNNTAGANPLNPVEQYYKIKKARENADYVIVIVHGGHEHCQCPSPRMKHLYRFFVDAGADAVVNHHQHCYSGYEFYNGKPIVYGLGNLLFDREGEIDGIWNYGYMVKLTFSSEKKVGLELFPYIQCNHDTTISLLDNEALDDFNNSIYRLNEIIADDNLLNQEWEKWISKDGDWVLPILFEPWHNRILKALYNRHLLPSYLQGERLYLIKNIIECESHSDRLKYLINKKVIEN